MLFEKIVTPDNSFLRAFIREEELDFCWHYHPEYELTLILQSSGKRYVGDCVSDYHTGYLVLVGPDLPHTWKSNANEKGKAVVLQFSRDCLGNDFFDIHEMRSVCDLLDSSKCGIQFEIDQSNAIYEKIVNIASIDGNLRVLMFLEILVSLAAMGKKSLLSTRTFKKPMNKGQQKRIEIVLNYINDNYHRTVPLDELASLVNISQSHFSQFFKKVTGSNFVSYVNDIRISRACELLSGSDKQIIKICFECGFNNVSNFNRQFLRRKSMSPQKYRKLFMG